MALIRSVLKEGFLPTLKLAYFGAATLQIRKAIMEGDHKEGVQLIGQVQGLVKDIPAVADIMQRVMQEADTALSDVQSQVRA
jgi:enoyl-[acyl-carrier protein] reductase II